MKVQQWERDIQGNNLCNVCRSSNPCGDVFNCAWWTSEEPEHQKDDRVQEQDPEQENI